MYLPTTEFFQHMDEFCIFICSFW